MKKLFVLAGLVCVCGFAAAQTTVPQRTLEEHLHFSRTLESHPIEVLPTLQDEDPIGTTQKLISGVDSRQTGTLLAYFHQLIKVIDEAADDRSHQETAELARRVDREYFVTKDNVQINAMEFLQANLQMLNNRNVLGIFLAVSNLPWPGSENLEATAAHYKQVLFEDMEKIELLGDE